MKNKIAYSLLIVSGCFYSTHVFAQREISIDHTATTNGKPLYTLSHESENGSPYLDKSWNKGSATFFDGKKVDNVQLKYDQVKDIVLFEKNGKEFEFSKPVKAFQYTDDKKRTVLFQSGFDSPTMFYQVLAEGSTLLLKRNLKRKVEKTPFNSATTTITFEPRPTYYIYSDNKLTKIKKSRKALSSLLADKGGELNTYFEEHPDVDNEEALIKLITFYNSL